MNFLGKGRGVVGETFEKRGEIRKAGLSPGVMCKEKLRVNCWGLRQENAKENP